MNKPPKGDLEDLLVWVSAPHREPHRPSRKLSAPHREPHQPSLKLSAPHREPHQQKPKTQRTTPRTTPAKVENPAHHTAIHTGCGSRCGSCFVVVVTTGQNSSPKMVLTTFGPQSSELQNVLLDYLLEDAIPVQFEHINEPHLRASAPHREPQLRTSAPHREPQLRTSAPHREPHQQKPKTQRTTPRSTPGVVRGVVRCAYFANQWCADPQISKCVHAAAVQPVKIGSGENMTGESERRELRQRFRKEYLGLLVQKGNEKKAFHQFQQGDIVLVGCDNRKRLDWPMGRIVELIPGRDGVCRVGKVKTASGILTRPVQRLFPLEISSARDQEEKVNVIKAPRKLQQQRVIQPVMTEQILQTKSGRTVKKPARYTQ
ncbi:hypothetical protein Fcan01_18317 [Folsomia candida]|uniref:DUF5641 domain-containing protein n=1 Tax=Folsomia candida TaxID=158441 RepID=A0A226DNE9_FOLCA|nr:hypothetical protein Fcan01_18317 [Folsomia candida]